jgi:hypothetical protein
MLHWNAFDGTEVDILWDSTDLDCPELKSDLKETESTGEIDSEQIYLLNLNVPFCIYLFLLIKIIFVFECW